MSEKKIDISPKNFLYPLPLAFVCANVIGRANFMVLTCFSVMSYNPDVVSVVLDRGLNINDGIRTNKSFSINFPNEKLLRKMDLGALYNGQIIDDNSFAPLFYGTYKKTPMMSECPVNLECSLTQTIEYSNDNLYIGKIQKAYGSASCVTGKKPDIERAQPLMLYMHDGRCWKLGRCLGDLPDMEKEFGIKRF